MIYQRILGLDYGDKSLGVSISDAMLLISSPLKTIKRTNPIDLSGTFLELENIINEYEIKTVVLGYPKNMDNTIGDRALKTEVFKKHLEKKFSIEVILWDERLSTISARNFLNEAKVHWKEQKSKVDKLAASLILQSYLDYKKSNERRDFMEFESRNEEARIIKLMGDLGDTVEYIVMDSFFEDSINYLLVIAKEDIDNEDCEAYALKEIQSDDLEIVYQFVEDEKEIDLIIKRLEDKNDDYDIV